MVLVPLDLVPLALRFRRHDDVEAVKRMIRDKDAAQMQVQQPLVFMYFLPSEACW